MNLIDQIDAASVPSGSVGIWFLGQASVVLRTERWTIYIDPYLSAEQKETLIRVYRGFVGDRRPPA